ILFSHSFPFPPNSPARAEGAWLTVLPRSQPKLELARTDVFNAVLRLTLTGPAGFDYALEQSTNVLHWQPFLTLTNLAGPTHLFLTNQNRSLFFRARVLP